MPTVKIHLNKAKDVIIKSLDGLRLTRHKTSIEDVWSSNDILAAKEELNSLQDAQAIVWSWEPTDADAVSSVDMTTIERTLDAGAHRLVYDTDAKKLYVWSDVTHAWEEVGAGASTDVFVKISPADSTANFLESKLIGTAGKIVATKINPGANEQIQLSAGGDLFDKTTDTTDSITVGTTNKFFTDQLAQDAVGATLTDTASLDLTYDGIAHTMTGDVKVDNTTIEVDGVNQYLKVRDGVFVTLATAQTITGDKTFTGNVQIGATGSIVNIIRDEDDMVSDDPNALATQQSIKAYVDNNAGTGGGVLQWVEVPVGLVTAVSTEVIPVNARIVSARIEVVTPYSVGGTLAVNVAGTAVTPLMIPYDSNPQETGLYIADEEETIAAPNQSGPISVTVSGAPAVGASVIKVAFIKTVLT